MINNRSRKLRKYQNDFTIKFAQLMSTQLPVWKKIQNEKRWSLCSITSILTYIGVSLLGYIPGKREYNYDFQFHFYASIILFIIAVIINIITTNKDYQNAIKSMLFPTLVKIFGEDIHYICNGTSYMLEALADSYLSVDDTADIIMDFEQNGRENISYRITNNIFEESKLYPKIITSREDDDRFYGKYNDIEFIINETDFGWNARDKNRTYHRMFKGIAMYFKLNKEVKNRVLIMSKSIFNKIPKEYEKVEVEYNEFARKYNVYVSQDITGRSAGQIEARYLLNTAFLDRFMQLHTSFSVPRIQCSIYGNRMLIMLSTGKDLFEMNHLFGRIDDVTQYKHLFEEFASVLSFIDVLNLSSKTKL